MGRLLEVSLHVVCKKIEKSLKSEHKEGEEVGKRERSHGRLTER